MDALTPRVGWPRCYCGCQDQNSMDSQAEPAAGSDDGENAEVSGWEESQEAKADWGKKELFSSVNHKTPEYSCIRAVSC